MNEFKSSPKIAAHIEKYKSRIDAVGISLSVKKVIDYGFQVKASSGGLDGMFNIYWSSKKNAVSLVDNTKNRVSAAAISILSGGDAAGLSAPSDESVEASFNRWTGSDESGKGDFFGPLVVCSFCCSRQEVERLLALGVKDSKLMNTAEIAEAANILRTEFAGSFQLGVYEPELYNLTYAKYGNLNTMLAAAHTNAIDELYKCESSAGHTVDGSVIDMFGGIATFDKSFFEDRKLTLVHRQKGESNIAVAAASVIARRTFEEKMAEMSDRFEMKFPFGASEAVERAARMFAVKHGKAALAKVAKVHFATMKKI